jgi:hypothetical protein
LGILFEDISSWKEGISESYECSERRISNGAGNYDRCYTTTAHFIELAPNQEGD